MTDTTQKAQGAWREHGENNGQPCYEIGQRHTDCYARVYNAFDNGLWSAIVNQRGHRPFDTAEDAKSFAVAELQRDIERRIASADRARTQLESLSAEPQKAQGSGADYANELREIAGMLAQAPDGPIRWKQYRLTAIADFLASLSQPPEASEPKPWYETDAHRDLSRIIPDMEGKIAEVKIRFGHCLPANLFAPLEGSITELRILRHELAAIPAPEASEVEAVAWLYERKGFLPNVSKRKPEYSDLVSLTPLYAHPPKASPMQEGARDSEDMEAVGNALMDAIEKDYASHPFMQGWHPADCPTEIVGDLLNRQDELVVEIAKTEAYPSLELCVQFSDDGQHIRKWSRLPFDGGTCLYSHPPKAEASALREAVYRFLSDYDDSDRAEAGNGPLMELHIAAFRAALAQPAQGQGEGSP